MPANSAAASIMGRRPEGGAGIANLVLTPPRYVIFDAPGGNSDTATLRWLTPSNGTSLVDHFEITSIPASISVSVSSSTYSYTVQSSSLTDGQRYMFQVASVHKNGFKAYSQSSNYGAFFIDPSNSSRYAFSYWDSNSVGCTPAGYSPTTWDPSTLPLTMTDGNNGLASDRYVSTGAATITNKEIWGTLTLKHGWTFTGCKIHTMGIKGQVISNVWPTSTFIDCEIIADQSGKTKYTRTVNDFSITAGSASFTSPSANLTANDVTYYVNIPGAGPNGVQFHSLLTSQTGTGGGLNNNASTSVSNTTATFSISSPTVAFSGAPFNITRCDIYGFGDCARYSSVGTGDTGWVWNKFYVHDFHDGVLSDGTTIIDTPHADGFQSFGKAGVTCGTVGMDNVFSQGVVDVRYPLTYVPNTYGMQGRAPLLSGGAPNNADLDSAMFWGTMLGDTVQNNIFKEMYVQGGSYTIAATQNLTYIFNAAFTRIRVGLYSTYDPPVRLDPDRPSGYKRFNGTSGSPYGYGTILFDASNVHDRTGVRTILNSQAASTWTFKSGMSVSQDQSITPLLA